MMDSDWLTEKRRKPAYFGVEGRRKPESNAVEDLIGSAVLGLLLAAVILLVLWN